MLPIALRGDGRRALIVGTGAVAQRKADTLRAAGFDVRFSEAYQSSDLDSVDIVIAATDDPDVNARVVDEARQQRVLVCDAADPGAGDFAMLATTRVGELTFAVDSGGSSPAFAKRIANDLREHFGPHHDAAARTIARMRTYVKTVVPQRERASVMRELASMPIETLARMTPIEAEHVVETTIERVHGERAQPATNAAVCATRGSALALVQSRTIAARLAEHGLATTFLTLTTTGDRVVDRPVADIGTDNVWVKELETALLDGRAAYAVHSCKDLPGTLTAGMQLAAISVREDPRDVYCSERFATFDELPGGSVVGTSSSRRRAQLRVLRPDLCFEDIRGNVDTRLRKLREGPYDAIVLAMAGISRLGARARYMVPFDPNDLVPAVAQGALAVETLATNTELAARLRRACNDERSELCVAAERAALRALRAGCNAPLGIHARLHDDAMTIEGAYALEERLIVLRRRLTQPVATIDRAEELGSQLGIALASQLAEFTPYLVVLPRTQERPSRIAAELRQNGIEVVELRDGPHDVERAPDMLVFPSSGSVTAAEPYLAHLRNVAQRPLVAAMGERSGSAARDAGFAPDMISPDVSIGAFVASIVERLTCQ